MSPTKFPIYVCRLLDDNGDGTGLVDMVGDFSNRPCEFRIVAPPNVDYHIRRMVVEIAGPVLNEAGYGNRNEGLDNGIRVWAAHKGGGVYAPFLSLQENDSVRCIADWAKLGGITSPTVGRVGQEQRLFVTVDFVELFGAPLVLCGNKEGKLVLQGRDWMGANGVGLTRHRATVFGQEFRNTLVTAGAAGN